MNRYTLVATLTLAVLTSAASAAAPISIYDIESSSGTLNVSNGPGNSVTLTAQGSSVTLNHYSATGISDYLQNKPNGIYFQSGDFKAEQKGSGYLITLGPVQGKNVTMTIASVTDLGLAMAASAKK